MVPSPRADEPTAGGAICHCLGGWEGRLELGLLGEPVFEHVARKADVAPDAEAGHPACAYSLIDPARLDRQQARGILGAEQRALGQRGRRVCR
jgi:hypothetical protein